MSGKFDIVIRDGVVIDGTGAAPIEADVGLKDGRIIEVGQIAARGVDEVNAKGQIVTPGFVDIHTHYDGQATWDNRLAPSSSHGVSTVVMGNCGVGFAPCRPDQHDLLIRLMDGVEDIPGVVLNEGVPWQWETFPQYLDFLSRRRFDVDVGAYIPHAALRVYAMSQRGADCEPATAHDIATMAELVREAISAGGLGFGTSRILFHRARDGKPIPTLKSSREELLGLARAMGEIGAGLIQYVGHYDNPDIAFAEIRDLAKLSGRPIMVSLMLGGADGPPMLKMLAQARNEGLPINVQVMLRPVSVLLSHETTLNPFYATAPYRALASAAFEQKIAALRQPELRREILNAPFEPLPNTLGSLVRNFDRMFCLGDPPNYEPAPADSIAAEATRRGVRPEELAYDLLLEKGGRNLLFCAIANYDAVSLSPHREALRQSGVLLGLGDGGAHCATLCDASFPTYMLTYWARDRRCGERLPLEFVVKRLTDDNAQLVGFHDRGRIAPSYRADLNIIDFDRLSLRPPHMVRDLPAGGSRLLQSASGYTAAIVNGEITYRNGQPTGRLPGRLVRGAQKSPAPH